MGKLKDSEAYLLGLLVAGGELTSNSFSVRLPLGRWALNPARGSQFVRDLLNDVLPEFKKSLGIDCTYEIEHAGDLVIRPNALPSRGAIDSLKTLLQMFGLPTSGTLVSTSSIAGVKRAIGANRSLGKRFLAGFFDVRASLELSHRRHVDSAPIVSIEVPGSGNNFKLVLELCSWMTEMGSTTDQVLWNHPSMHSGLDPTYKQWRKGFKIRVLAADFASVHNFGMNVFSIALRELVANQTKSNQTPCSDRAVKFKKTSIHMDCGSPDLPPEIRDQVFLHFHQVCAAMGCPYAPTGNLGRQMAMALDSVAFWPLLLKGTPGQIGRAYIKESIPTDSKLKFCEEKPAEEFIGHGLEQAFPKLKDALAYLVADTLKGKRPGPVEAVLALKSTTVVRLYNSTSPGSPLILVNSENNRAALVGPATSSAAQRTSGRVFIDGTQVRLRSIQ